MGEYPGFAEVNEYVYHSVRNTFFDAVIWCLGPVVDDTRDYHWSRLWLASVTYQVCRRVIRTHN